MGNRIVVDLDISSLLLDGDDTLWRDAIYYARVEILIERVFGDVGISGQRFWSLLHKSLAIKGPGEKGFVSAIEALTGKVPLTKHGEAELASAIEGFKTHPIEVFPYVEEALRAMLPRRLYLLTKGLRAEQERKIELSGLAHYFDDIIVVGKKSASVLASTLSRLGLSRAETLCIGNSIKHDIMPAVNCGAPAIWMDTPENLYGRNSLLPNGVPRVESWGEFLRRVKVLE